MLEVLECLFTSPEFSFCLLVGRPKAARVGNGIQNGHFHRDAPGETLTSANTITVLMCLDAMSPAKVRQKSRSQSDTTVDPAALRG